MLEECAAHQHGVLASGSEDTTIKLWDLTTRECLMTLEGHGLPVFCLEKLEGGFFASGSEESTIKVWEVATGACVATLRGGDAKGDIISLAALEGGRLASASEDVDLWHSMLLRGP